jgi:hypothetical protein
MTTNNQLNDAKFRISFSLAELKTLQHFLSLPSPEVDALDILPLVSKIRKAELKASVGITLPAYSGKTSVPGMVTMARIAYDEKYAKGETNLNRLRGGEVLTEVETCQAMEHLIETLHRAPESPEEKEAMATYMHVKVFGASQA